MKFFKRLSFGKRTDTRSHSFVESPTSVSSVLVEIEEDEIDYSSSIQQETGGIQLQKNHRLMIEETNEALVRWSAEYKKLIEKHKRLMEKNEAYLEPYTTTRNLFVVAISALDQVGARFDESSKELSKILQNLPKHEDRSIKSQFEREISTLKEAKRDLDVFENKQEQIKNDLSRIRGNLNKCRLNTTKHNKLQQRQNSLRQERIQLKKDIVREKEKYQQAQIQYRNNMKTIYQQSQNKELDRLKKMPQVLKKFVAALKVDSSLLDEAIQNHHPETDLTSWKEKYFSASFKEISV